MKQLSILADARFVKRSAGRGYLRQLLDIVSLKTRNPTLGASDYYSYRLYDRHFLGSELPENFLGWRVESALAEALNPRNVVLPAWDKLTFLTIARAFGLPVPGLRAIYWPGPAPGNLIGGAVLSSEAELTVFLRTNPDWPLFLKPSYCQRGLGTYLVTGYDRVEDALTLKDEGRSLPVRSFFSEVIQGGDQRYYRKEMGYLFQEVLRPEPSIARIIGNDAISGLRIVCVRVGDRAEIACAVWKIAVGKNYVDNFSERTTGNLMALVDIATGRPRIVLNAFWPRGSVVARSPATGIAFSEFQLPFWRETQDLVRTASGAFPLMRIQHWDVAITDAGPCLLELNDVGGIAFLQLGGIGLLSTAVGEALKQHGNRARYAWIAGIR